ncbi:MAG: response regulator [bacterium]
MPPPAKVLIVDDAPAILESMSKALQRLGVPAAGITTASTRADAVRLFLEKKPTLTFLDMDLGGDAGDGAAHEILELAPLAKIVIVTGLDRESARVRAVVSAGAYDVIEKPVRLVRLREVLDLIESEEKGLRRVL